MLVLTRKINQQVQVGDDITITVLKINNGSIRLGIEAPRNVRILRSEIERFEDSDASIPAASGSSGVTNRIADQDSGRVRFEMNVESRDLLAGQEPDEHSGSQVYQLRGKLSKNASQGNTRGEAAPLARFLPPVPPAVQERSSSYSA